MKIVGLGNPFTDTEDWQQWVEFITSAYNWDPESAVFTEWIDPGNPDERQDCVGNNSCLFKIGVAKDELNNYGELSNLDKLSKEVRKKIRLGEHVMFDYQRHLGMTALVKGFMDRLEERRKHFKEALLALEKIIP